MHTANGYLMIGAAGEPIRVRAVPKPWDTRSGAKAPLSTTRLPNRGAHEATMEAVPTTDTTEHWVEVREAPPGCRAPRSTITNRCSRIACLSPRPCPMRHRPRTGRRPAHPRPGQDRRQHPSAYGRPEARPAQRRDLG